MEEGLDSDINANKDSQVLHQVHVLAAKISLLPEKAQEMDREDKE